MILQLIRSNFYRLFPIVSIFICLGVLIGSGIAFLIQKDWFLWWCLGGLFLSIISILIRKYFSADSNKVELPRTSKPQKSWNKIEKIAWERVQELANRAENSPPKNVEQMREAALELLGVVSSTLHPKSEFASAHFTIPDVLFAAEKGIKDLRSELVSKLPGSDVIKISQILRGQAWYNENRALLKGGMGIYRLFRVGMNPTQAFLQEMKSYFESKSVGGTLEFVHGQLARFALEEIGRSAIDLYGGRLSADIQTLVDSANRTAPEPTKELIVRVALFGQVNSGKSSLINSLLEDIQASVSELPTESGVKEFRLKSTDRPDLVLIDTPGLDGKKSNEKIMLKEAEKADLILWVVSATNPARSIDHDAIKILQENFESYPDRKSPPIIVVTTHIDRLSPQREWQPPYDIENPIRTKAINIRAALEAVASALVHESNISVPVSIRTGTEPYNLDALWLAMSMNLDDAKHTALDRAYKKHSNFSFLKLASQTLEGGRFLVGITFNGIKRKL